MDSKKKKLDKSMNSFQVDPKVKKTNKDIQRKPDNYNGIINC